MFRRFVQLRTYTKRVVVAWAVMLVLGSIFDMYTLFWLGCMMAFVIPAIKTFVGLDMVYQQLDTVKDKVGEVAQLIPRASTCARAA